MTLGRLIRQWIGFFLLLAGLAVIAWPFIQGHAAGQQQNQSLEQALREIYRTGDEEAEAATEAEESTDVMEGAPSETTDSLTEATDSEQDTAAENERTSDAETQEAQTDSKQADAPAVQPVPAGNLFGAYASLQDRYRGAGDGQLAALYAACLSYNERLYASGQAGLDSLKSTERFDLDTTAYGFSENVIGAIWVPRMGVQFALYLGAGTMNLNRGTAILGKTSIPMSIGTNHTAIAGHRGASGTAMFRDIQTMQMGDPIYIITPWELLTYRVSSIKIVSNMDLTWTYIQEGRNQISLMTCHPYTQNYQRYIVTADLSEEPFPGVEAVEYEMEATKDESPREVIEMDTEGVTEIVYVDSSSIKPDSREYGSNVSNLVILAESKMKGLLIGVSVLCLLAFVRVVLSTREYLVGRRKRSQSGEITGRI